MLVWLYKFEGDSESRNARCGGLLHKGRERESVLNFMLTMCDARRSMVVAHLKDLLRPPPATARRGYAAGLSRCSTSTQLIQHILQVSCRNDKVQVAAVVVEVAVVLGTESLAQRAAGMATVVGRVRRRGFCGPHNGPVCLSPTQWGGGGPR